MRRRKLLAVVGGAATLAGCMGGGESNGNNQGEDSEPESTSEPTETATPGCTGSALADDDTVAWKDEPVGTEEEVGVVVVARNDADFPIRVSVDVDFHESDAPNAPAVKSETIRLGILSPEETAKGNVIVDREEIVTYSTNIIKSCA